MAIIKKTPAMDPQQPRMLRKEIKRIRASRDNLKDKNRNKSNELYNIRDSLREVKLSRNRWKTEAKELGNELRLVQESIQWYKQELENLHAEGEEKKRCN